MSRSSTNEYYYIPEKIRSRFPGVVFWRVNGPLPCTPSERDGLSDSLRLLGTLYPLSPLKRSSSVLDTRSSPLSSELRISDNTSSICLGGSVSGMGFGEPAKIVQILLLFLLSSKKVKTEQKVVFLLYDISTQSPAIVKTSLNIRRSEA